VKVFLKLTRFHSSLDEEMLFYGFSKIDAIKVLKGEGRGLWVELRLAKLDRSKAVALMGVLTRYKISLQPMTALAARPRFQWMTTEGWYWERQLKGAMNS
jgi:hypothetical protein